METRNGKVVKKTTLAVLLLEPPRMDLLDLLRSPDVHAIWPDPDGFNSTGLDL
jgi:hypothetical protein